MADEQDWRLRVNLADAAGFHGRLRSAHHFERELEPLISPDIVLSYDDDTLFAYANTQAAIDQARRAIEHQLESEGAQASMVVSHWDDGLGEVGDWHQVDPPESGGDRAHEDEERAAHTAAEERAVRVETRTFAITSGKWARSWYETAAADEARAAGVELSIVEHPHLLTTQIAFTLTGQAGKIDTVIEDLKARAGQLTRLEAFPV
ncbi:MAG TPA: hypothetical protein VN772_04165 [Solirubrobacteraceae bacterium]|nr:hypothetical protein [Solirubrobacteraceae bacterium]